MPAPMSTGTTTGTVTMRPKAASPTNRPTRPAPTGQPICVHDRAPVRTTKKHDDHEVADGHDQQADAGSPRPVAVAQEPDQPEDDSKA